jgi:hypothetical protein
MAGVNFIGFLRYFTFGKGRDKQKEGRFLMLYKKAASVNVAVTDVFNKGRCR